VRPQDARFTPRRSDLKIVAAAVHSILQYMRGVPDLDEEDEHVLSDLASEIEEVCRRA